MKRSWVSIVSVLLCVLNLGACVRSVEVNPEDAVEASEHFGNIRIVDKRGIEYYAQSIEEGEEGYYTLNMVQIVDDGVSKYVNEYSIAKASIVKVHYFENNRWIVGGALTALAVFMIYLYYSINTSIFD
jgi:hypothetical protein